MSVTLTPATSARSNLPQWALDAIQLYESNAANQFIVFGNVNDQMVIPGTKLRLGSLSDFLLEILLPQFDVVLSYDIGNGIRVEKGGEIFGRWPQMKEEPTLPRAPRAAVETLTHYFRFVANLSRLNRERVPVSCIIRSADLLAPALGGGFDYDLNALASLIRDWSSESLLAGHSLATFLITENLNDLHPLVVNNPRAARVKIALPSPEDLTQAFNFLGPCYPSALKEFGGKLPAVAQQLAGSTLGAVETLLKTREHSQQALSPKDLIDLKKQLVEKDCNGLAYQDGEHKGEAHYNYSPIPAIQELTAIFQNTSTTLEFGRRLAYYHQYQKLALDDELKRMEEMNRSGNMAELQAVAPLLKEIVADTSVINVTRARAQRLLVVAGAHKGM